MESTDARTLKFGSFELDVRLRELRTGSTRVRLQEQPFEILRLMLERPGDVVTREQLRQRLWPAGTYVDFEHSLNAAVKRLRAALGDDAENPRFVETLPRRGYRFIARLDAPETMALPARAAAPRPRLAVLPFANLSEDPSQDYFSDGLTEEMISQLGSVSRGRLAVVARWSSMVFKGTTRRAREIGETLRVDYLVEGGVRRDGERVRITVRLVEVATETNLWSDVYDRELADFLRVQTDVAARVARSLAMELAPSPDHAADYGAAAYQAYLKGRYYWNKPFDDGVKEAIDYYQRALDASPSFGAAHAALARAHVCRAEFYHVLPRQALKEAEASAARALTIDPTLYEAHLALGDVRRMHDLDWAGAEASYEQAIAQNPSYESAHRCYGMMLSVQARHAEAIRASERACELDPLCLVVGTTAAWTRYAAGDFDAAVDHSRNTIDMDPEFMPARRVLAAAYLQSGRETEALSELESAVSLAEGDSDPMVIAWLAHAKAVTGNRRAATTLIARAQSLARERYVPPYHLAMAYVGLNSIDAAFEMLDQAWLDRDPALAGVHVEPRFEPLRADRRYQELLKRLKLS
ncbi:MAG TPA: winged helix-turn-helix domain-containing protein [Vicinamibacterales bacterium]|nr:winged helix-turn-helix domain-containing protein [Vicinamibacterales bacterium]